MSPRETALTIRVRPRTMTTDGSGMRGRTPAARTTPSIAECVWNSSIHSLRPTVPARTHEKKIIKTIQKKKKKYTSGYSAPERSGRVVAGHSYSVYNGKYGQKKTNNLKTCSLFVLPPVYIAIINNRPNNDDVCYFVDRTYIRACVV